jgi:hypothetical protein
MLGPPHADRRQLGDLAATELLAGAALLLLEPMPAPTTRLRVVIDDLIDLILGLQLTTGTPMPRLPASRSTVPFSHELLRLRAGLRPPLSTRFRRI